MMKALVTGVAGFIGSTLAERLVADGMLAQSVGEVAARLDCRPSGSDAWVEEVALATVSRPGDRRTGTAAG